MAADLRYDDVPYPGRAVTQTHPDRLATLARLFGVAAPEPATCRTLEVGCGDGANLLAMADALPEAMFTGIDTSPRSIAAARARAEELGLTNVRFDEVSLADHAPTQGSVDYVIAHGVFSWVAEPLRDALLALCASALSEHGVAYISYNALPGGRLRQILREILATELDGIDDPPRKIAAARELLGTLRCAWTYDEGLSTLVGLAKTLGDASDALLYHDTLSPANTPLYFRDFIAHAARHRLGFLAEANFWEMQVGWLPHDVRPRVLATAGRVAREQQVDLMRMRTFRQTLLCHVDRELTEVVPERLEGLAAAAMLRADAPARDGTVTFHGDRGQKLTTDQPLVIEALARLAAAWPAALTIADLWPPATAAEDRRVVCEMLLRCYSADLVSLHAGPIAVGTSHTPRPRVSALARLQARENELVTNLRHQPVELDDDLRALVALLDGTRDRDALGDDRGLDELARRALLTADGALA